MDMVGEPGGKDWGVNEAGMKQMDDNTAGARMPPSQVESLPPLKGVAPPEERVATFDQDGTLWVEHPMYTQVMYCLERVPALVKAKPELEEVEPFKTVLSGDREAMAKLPMEDLEKILAATLTGMTVESSRPKRRSGSRRPRTRAGSARTPS